MRAQYQYITRLRYAVGIPRLVHRPRQLACLSEITTSGYQGTFSKCTDDQMTGLWVKRATTFKTNAFTVDPATRLPGILVYTSSGMFSSAVHTPPAAHAKG
jgi:hypothetical protein